MTADEIMTEIAKNDAYAVSDENTADLKAKGYTVAWEAYCGFVPRLNGERIGEENSINEAAGWYQCREHAEANRPNILQMIDEYAAMKQAYREMSEAVTRGELSEARGTLNTLVCRGEKTFEAFLHDDCYLMYHFNGYQWYGVTNCHYVVTPEGDVHTWYGFPAMNGFNVLSGANVGREVWKSSEYIPDREKVIHQANIDLNQADYELDTALTAFSQSKKKDKPYALKYVERALARYQFQTERLYQINQAG
jgi:hypothetical protein